MFDPINSIDSKEREIIEKLHQIILNQDADRRLVDSNSRLHESVSEIKEGVSRLQTEIRDIYADIGQRLRSIETRIESLAPVTKRQSLGVYLWQIDRLAAQQSDAFYSHENGYKMRLQLTPERSWLRFGAAIVVRMVQGANDKNLQWPVEFDVRIGVVNQETGQFFRSEKQIIVFRTSTATHESPFKFTPYDLSGSAWKNNCLLIKCIVN